MANEKQRDPKPDRSISSGKPKARARVADEEAGEDETSAEEYNQRRGGEDRAIGAEGKSRPTAERRKDSKTTASDAPPRVDEEVERDEEEPSHAEALEGEIGEQTETRHRPGPRAAGSNPEVF
jgi:hypothetical protein